MLSVKPSHIVRSHAFKRTVMVFAGLTVVLGLGVVAYSAFLLSEADMTERELIDERLEEISEHIREDGLEEVIDEHSHEFGALWPQEEAEHFFESEEVMILVLQDSKPVLGFPELLIESGWHETTYLLNTDFNESEDIELRARRVDLSDGVSIVGALARTASWHHAIELTQTMAYLLLAFFVVSVLGSYLASRLERPDNRINTSRLAR